MPTPGGRGWHSVLGTSARVGPAHALIDVRHRQIDGYSKPGPLGGRSVPSQAPECASTRGARLAHSVGTLWQRTKREEGGRGSVRSVVPTRERRDEQGGVRWCRIDRYGRARLRAQSASRLMGFFSLSRLDRVEHPRHRPGRLTRRRSSGRRRSRRDCRRGPWRPGRGLRSAQAADCRAGAWRRRRSRRRLRRRLR